MHKPVYLLTGESFLAAEALAKIRAEVQTDPLSEISLDSGASGARIQEVLGTPSLLGGTRLVLINDAHELKADQVAAVEHYLESPSPHAVLVLIASGRTKLAGAAKKAGAVVALEAPKGRRLAAWVRDRAKARKLALDERAAWALIDSVGVELRDIDAGLEQLSTSLGSNAKVGEAEVRRSFPRLADERIYVFTDAVGERKLAPAMGALRRLLEQGDEPLMLFGALASHIRRILVARGYGGTGGARAVASALGLPEWRAERLYRQARAYREDELQAALETLAETDVEMKGGDLPPDIALERAVITIVAGA